MLLKIEFEEAIWQKVIDMLAQQPYRDVGPIIGAIAQQFGEQRAVQDQKPKIEEDKVSRLKRDTAS